MLFLTGWLEALEVRVPGLAEANSPPIP
jgi:hypothetical protein